MVDSNLKTPESVQKGLLVASSHDNNLPTPVAMALVPYSASNVDPPNQNSNVNVGQPLSGANNTTESFSHDPPQKNLWQLRDTTSLSGGVLPTLILLLTLESFCHKFLLCMSLL